MNVLHGRHLVMLAAYTVLAAYATLFATPSAAGAFELSGQQWPQSGPGAPVTLTYSYNNLLNGGLLDATGMPLREQQIVAAVEEAFSVWASVAPLHFVEVADQGGTPPISNYDRGRDRRCRRPPAQIRT